jgi:hypothetical protein
MTGRPSRLPASRGALPPAFGSPRDIYGQMNAIFPAFICPRNIPGVRAQPEGAAPSAPSATGRPA